METSTLLILALLLAGYIVYRLSSASSFWNVPGPKPRSFMLGNMRELSQEPAGLAEFEWQHKYGDVVRFRSSFGTDQLLIADPRALQHVLQSSGYRWRKSPVRREIARLLAGKGLAWADGDVHTRQRKVMLAGFRVQETKHFVPSFIACAEAMSSCWKDAITSSSDNSQVFNLPEYVSGATLDALGHAAFQYDFGATGKHDNELANLYESLTANAFSAPSGAALLMLDLFRHIPPSVMEFLNDHNPKLELFRRLAHVGNQVAGQLVAKKLEEIREGRESHHFLSLLVEANMSENPKFRLTEEELLAQMRNLIFGGHETVTDTLYWAFYELACKPELQERLRTEIWSQSKKIEERGDSEFTMQDFDDMPLLTAMVKETLRFYPVVIHLFRTAHEDDLLPLSRPIVGVNGNKISEIPVPKGTQVIGSISAYNRNKRIFGEDSFTFNPDRWLEGRVKADDVTLGVYANLATFAAGIRSCIGWKFAVTELQAFIVVLLRNFEIGATPKLAKIRRESALGMVPTIEGELEKGAQLPLRVSLVSNAAE